MSCETSGLSVDILLDLILEKLPEEARSARYCSGAEVGLIMLRLSAISRPIDACGYHSSRNSTPRHPASSLKFVLPGTLLVRSTLSRQRRWRSSSNMSSMGVLDRRTHQGRIFTSGLPLRESADTGASQLSRSPPFGQRCRWATSLAL